MIARVRRLEAGRTAASPIAQAFGSFQAFTAWADAEVAAGVLDTTDFPLVLIYLARWERDGL